ncbi:phosphoribosylglycinamide formyltransferase [Tenacibaculum sp. ZS6-P6]|uniref:phosphoribosylglycinamide formyltransferase n=1 Tax=Tenacibaculum sp. ZS6-P6 TaxID=3447503 RepID=UPI003F9C019D
MKRIVIFASGSGSNAENIIGFFQTKRTAKVTHVLTNNERAKVLERCKRLGVSSLVFDREEFFKSDKVLDFLKKEADLIILAGFLWKVPEHIVVNFPNKIVNIHPALLPKYGGKGMYGSHVHKAIKNNKETETGITIHYVNEHYDEGAIIFQEKTALSPEDSVEDIARKVHELEYEHYPKVIEDIILSQNE